MLMGLRVLVVEDFGLLALQIRIMLERLGCIVEETAGTLEEGFAALDGGEPDLAVLDVDLGGVLVTPLAVHLRQRGIPFVLATAWDPEALPLPLRGETLLAKPVSLDALAEALHDVCERRATTL